MSLKGGDIVKIKGSSTGRYYEIYELRDEWALIKREGSKDKGGWWEPIENLRKVKDDNPNR